MFVKCEPRSCPQIRVLSGEGCQGCACRLQVRRHSVSVFEGSMSFRTASSSVAARHETPYLLDRLKLAAFEFDLQRRRSLFCALLEAADFGVLLLCAIRVADSYLRLAKS